MTEKKTSESQRRAAERWNEKNKDRRRFNSARSNARTFARGYAENRDQVEELLEIFDRENKNAKKTLDLL